MKSNNWQGNIFFNEGRTKAAFENNFRTDVRFAFVIDDENPEPEKIEYLNAHKLILAFASEVFDKMFYGDLSENTDEDIVISDITPNLFAKMLKYIYTDVVYVDDFQDCIEIFCLAKTYKLHALENYCLAFLLEELTIKNALEIYELSEYYKIEKLSAAALELIRRRTKEVINTEYFRKIRNETLVKIVEQQKLQTSEIELFLAVESLALKQGAIQNVRRDEAAQAQELDSNLFAIFRAIVKQIRFLAMTIEEFLQGPAYSALLTLDEVFQIIICLTQSKMIEKAFPKEFCRRRKRRIALPRVFFDIVHDGSALGRIVIKLRTDCVPKSAERFLNFCIGKNQSFKGSKFWRVGDEVCCGRAIDVKTQETLPIKYCEPENFILKHDSVGVLGACVDVGSLQQSEDQFYISFQKTPSHDNKNVVFGKVVDGFEVLEQIKAVAKDGTIPLKNLIIKNCGELYF